MKMLKWLGTWVAAVFIAGCGGGGGSAGTPPFGGGDTGGTNAATAAMVEVIGSATQVGSSGGQITISAFVKSAANASLPAAPVSFSTDTGTLSSVSIVTDAAGLATAKFSTGSNRSNRTAKITVTSGTVSGVLNVDIVGTSLAYSGPTTFTLGAASQVTVKATDSGGNAIANLAVTVASSLANGLAAATLTTDSQGSASVNYTATNAGTDRLTFASAGTTAVAKFTISGENFKFIDPQAATQVVVGESQVVTVQYVRNGVAKSGVTINFTTTAGVLKNVDQSSLTVPILTGIDGKASVRISSLSAVAATVQASFSFRPTVSDPVISGSANLPLQFIATTPAVLVLQTSPSAIGPNAAGSTAQQAQVQARVTDINGNPVANQTVNFSRLADPSGGNLSQPSAVTDLNGLATVQYVAGPQSTANNGIELKGSITPSTGDPVIGMAMMTVNQTALFIALGTGNVIGNLDPQTYKKDWVVYVTDSNGVTVPGVTLTIKVLPTRYRKGTLSYFISDKVWRYDAPITTCDNEDDNPQNGVLDPSEDVNGDGKLWPGNVISVTPGTIKTDADGRATISLIYAESYVPWVEVKLTVSAIVSGTESKGETVFFVVGEAGDFVDPAVPPAGVTSPFGTDSVCTSPN